jgi:predicted transcriptional regulator
MDIEVQNETELWVTHALVQGQNMTPESISEELAIEIGQDEIKNSLESLEDQGIVEHRNGWELSR